MVLLAGALSLDSADRSTLSAVEAQLVAQLHIGTVGFGLLATVTSVVGLVATFPVGMLVDRVRRTPAPGHHHRRLGGGRGRERGLAVLRAPAGLAVLRLILWDFSHPVDGRAR